MSQKRETLRTPRNDACFLAIVPTLFAEIRKWNNSAWRTLAFAFNCAQHDSRCATASERKSECISQEANENRTRRASALFPAALDNKKQKGGLGWERVFLVVAQVADAECVPGAEPGSVHAAAGDWRPRARVARAIMPFLFPVESINVYNASKTRRASLKWKTRGRNLICFSRRPQRVSCSL